MRKAKEALYDMIQWDGTSEIDLYPYVRDVFIHLLGYPKAHVRLTDKGSLGKIPDISLTSADSNPRDRVYWMVGEVKKESKVFWSADYRRNRWEKQLKQYVSADTVYALLIDPQTIAILRPDGSEVKTVKLDEHNVKELLSPTSDCSLAALHYKNSVCETSLILFKEGRSPSRYLDVTNAEDREKFYTTLKISTRELFDFSHTRLSQLQQQYLDYQANVADLESKVGTVRDEDAERARRDLEQQYEEAINLFENILKAFQAQIGRQIPTKEKDAHRFVQDLYATEGSSLVLARILFVRFLEDNEMTLRKISNGGIKAFRDYHLHIKDDYQFLLTDACKEAEQLYRHLFERSIFDWSHKGDGQFSRLLLRIFYRLNGFDFTKITGDILGNLYERFLDINKRKKLGEYYTPLYVARYVIQQIGFYENPATLLDPACGSGTFLIAATVGLIEHLVQKGVKLDVAVNQAVELIHGLDINVFAAFIAQLQLIWHLLPYLNRADMKQIPELKIYGGINSLEYKRQRTLISTVLGLPPEKPIKIRNSKFRYIVGNPPFIRNERLKDMGPWRKNYDQVDFRNSDIAYFFVTRTIEGKRDRTGIIMPSWLEEGGRMCFVLPMGLCDAQTAKRIRERLMKYNILEITDLEQVAIHIFPSPQASGRATVAPVLLFAEKTQPDEKKIELVQVAEQAASVEEFQSKYLERSKLPQSIFRKSNINPYAQFLTKLRADDLPILRLLMTNSSMEDYGIKPTPTFGIKVGGARRLSREPTVGFLPLGKGQNIFAYYLSMAISRWVDIRNVTDKSIWGKPDILSSHQAYAFSNIALAPQCVIFDPNTYALNNSTVLFIPKPEFKDFPWDVLLNSSVLRFICLSILRVGLIGVGTPIEGGRRVSWCHVNPRTISAFPVPQNVLEYTQSLSTLGQQLRSLGTKIARRWDVVAEEMARCRKQPLSLHNVDFSNWQSDLKGKLNFHLAEEGDVWTLKPYIGDQLTLFHIEGSYELLHVLKFLLDARKEKDLTIQTFQNLMVPEDPETISRLIDVASDPNSFHIREFKKHFMEADNIIAEAYNLNETQWKYVQNRLATPPFDVLQPRWPWESVEIREIKEYDKDRFA